MIRIAFIATREPEYSRVSIVSKGLARAFGVDWYMSSLTSYTLRLAVVVGRLLWGCVTGRLRKADAVFVGFFAQPIFPLVRLLYRGPIIADAYFSMFDTMVHDKRKVAAKSLVGRLCFWLDRYMLRNAELCLTDTNQHVEYMRTTFDAPQADIRRLWIGAEGKPLNQPIQVVQDGQPFEVFFWGGFIPLQGVEVIIQAANILQREDIRFTLVGAGQTFPRCLELKEQLQLANVEFGGWQKPELILERAAVSHIALGIFGTTDKAARVIPNKAFEALLMGIPLITCRSPAVDELLQDQVHCLLVDPGDPEQLADRIRWARDNYDSTRAMAASGQKRFLDCCSTEMIGKQLEQQIGSLVVEGHAGVHVKQASLIKKPISRHPV